MSGFLERLLVISFDDTEPQDDGAL